MSQIHNFASNEVFLKPEGKLKVEYLTHLLRLFGQLGQDFRKKFHTYVMISIFCTNSDKDFEAGKQREVLAV